MHVNAAQEIPKIASKATNLTQESKELLQLLTQQNSELKVYTAAVAAVTVVIAELPAKDRPQRAATYRDPFRV